MKIEPQSLKTFADLSLAMATPRGIVVVGSMNMDLVARMQRLPRPGETVTGESFLTVPGGKGANQAVASARLGARVTMVARVGSDDFGAILRQNLISDGINTDHVFVTQECSSGVALIGVESTGANSITVIPGANGRLSVDDVNSCREIIESADALVVQLESPIETIAAAVQIAKDADVLTILDPAPAPSSSQGLPLGLISVDVISPNQTEAEALTGVCVTNWDSARMAALELRRRGASHVVIKLGELGALALHKDGTMLEIAATPVPVVDTTAAGDAFTAALAVALCQRCSLQEATQWGVMAGTLACTRFGAQPAMPTWAEFETFMGRTLTRPQS